MPDWLWYALLGGALLAGTEFISYRLFVRRHGPEMLRADIANLLAKNEELEGALSSIQTDLAAIRRGEVHPPKSSGQWLTEAA